MKRVLLFGASGSIGGSTLDVLRSRPEEFRLAGLSVHSNTAPLAGWIHEFAPARVQVTDPAARGRWAAAHPQFAGRLLPADSPPAALLETPADIALNGVLGFAGLAVTLAVLAAGLDLALANKESLVCGGEVLAAARRRARGCLLPVDSEHSALAQLLAGRPREQLRRVWLTASGGPFRELPATALASVTPEQALRHPTWRMGAKISVDSATLMNKGFEVIEAAQLFDLSAAMIGVLIHPGSLAHALVELSDASMLCQLAAPDMRQPILAALSHPERPAADYGRLDLDAPLRLDFAPLDAARFPAVDLARAALAAGGTAPLALNAADELAVAAFLAGNLPFTGIVAVVEAVLACGGWEPAADLPALIEADARARALAAEQVQALERTP
jgi:1-deoxy-D-xylulose-5-phosphate reductoisomerase